MSLGRNSNFEQEVFTHEKEHQTLGSDSEWLVATVGGFL
jgi:hypothetical protein